MSLLDKKYSELKPEADYLSDLVVLAQAWKKSNQHIRMTNSPYKERFEKLITHVHGAHQVSISSFNMNMFDFRDIGRGFKSNKKVKTKPAGG